MDRLNTNYNSPNFAGRIPKDLTQKIEKLLQRNGYWHDPMGFQHTTLNNSSIHGDVFIRAVRRGDNITVAVEDRKNDKGFYAKLKPCLILSGYKVAAQGELTDTVDIVRLKNKNVKLTKMTVSGTTKKLIEYLKQFQLENI